MKLKFEMKRIFPAPPWFLLQLHIKIKISKLPLIHNSIFQLCLSYTLQNVLVLRLHALLSPAAFLLLRLHALLSPATFLLLRLPTPLSLVAFLHLCHRHSCTSSSAFVRFIIIVNIFVYRNEFMWHPICREEYCVCWNWDLKSWIKGWRHQFGRKTLLSTAVGSEKNLQAIKLHNPVYIFYDLGIHGFIYWIVNRTVESDIQLIYRIRFILIYKKYIRFCNMMCNPIKKCISDSTS